MNYLKQVEEAVGSVQPDAKYVWFDADTIIYLASLVDARLDLSLECAEGILKRGMKEFQAKIEEEIGLDVIIVPCLSQSRTFRHDILPSYKGNRKGKWRPPLLGHYRQTFRDLYNPIEWDNHEADDIVAALHTQIPGHVCASSDKDLLQVPGTLYNPRTEKAVDISIHIALYNRLYQWLCGDSADGYKGCYLIGDIKAKKLLDELLVEESDIFCTPEAINVPYIVNVIAEVYDKQNKAAIKKGKEPNDMFKQFAVSQIRTEFTDRKVYLPDPVAYLSAFLTEGQNNVPLSSQ